MARKSQQGEANAVGALDPAVHAFLARVAPFLILAGVVGLFLGGIDRLQRRAGFTAVRAIQVIARIRPLHRIVRVGYTGARRSRRRRAISAAHQRGH